MEWEEEIGRREKRNKKKRGEEGDGAGGRGEREEEEEEKQEEKDEQEEEEKEEGDKEEEKDEQEEGETNFLSRFLDVELDKLPPLGPMTSGAQGGIGWAVRRGRGGPWVIFSTPRGIFLMVYARQSQGWKQG